MRMTRQRRAGRVLLAGAVLLAVLGSVGCGPPVTVERRGLGAAAAARGAAWPGDGVSDASWGWLRTRGLADAAERRPRATAAGLMNDRGDRFDAQLAAAELAFVAGLDGDGPALALAAAAATRAVDLAAEGSTLATRAAVRAVEVQRLALAGLIRDGKWGRRDVAGVGVRIVRDDGGDRRWDDGQLHGNPGVATPDASRRLKLVGVVPADLLAVDGLAARHARGGVGCPVVLRLMPEGTDDDLLFFPPGGVALDATAVATLDPPAASPDGSVDTGSDPPTYTLRVRLLDPPRHRTVAVADRPTPQSPHAPLAADFSVAYALVTGRKNEGPSPFALMLDPAQGMGRTGLYLLEPYDPGKTPLVLVHGLKSSPRTWYALINALRGDLELRRRYQVLLFFYPTGDPFAVSAAALRKALRTARRELDPQHDNAGWDDYAVVAHSMGGLLASMLVKSGGDDLWHGVMHDRDLDELDLEPAQRERLRESFWFEPLPGVERVVFIATPLRGAPLAKTWYADLGRLLTEPAPELEAAADRLLEKNPQGLNPYVRDFAGGVVTGIGDLSPDSPLIQALARRSIAPSVTTHIIVGQTEGRWPTGSDGIVPHASSRLDAAESTLIVPGVGHGVLQDPRAVQEVLRILRLHAARSTTE